MTNSKLNNLYKFSLVRKLFLVGFLCLFMVLINISSAKTNYYEYKQHDNVQSVQYYGDRHSKKYRHRSRHRQNYRYNQQYKYRQNYKYRQRYKQRKYYKQKRHYRHRKHYRYRQNFRNNQNYTLGQNYTKNYGENHTKNYEQRYFNKEYSRALKTLWTKVYPHKGKTLYCGKPFSTKNYRERKKHVNAEHVYPVSWMTKGVGCGTRKSCQKSSLKFRNIMSDLHNIYPARIDVNKARSNYPFGVVKGEKRVFGQCDFEVNRKLRVAEPADSSKGSIARAMLYINYQYKLSLHRKVLKQVKAWDKKYPPNPVEIKRHNAIKRYQRKTNPFIANYPFNP